MLTEQPDTLVDNPVDRCSSHKLVEAFVKFFFTLVAQKIFVDNGFCPVMPGGKAYARGNFGILSSLMRMTLVTRVKQKRLFLVKVPS